MLATMARKLRKIVPGLPVHVVQRGVNKCDIFASDRDRLSYIEFMTEAADTHGCAVHCYALMGNHVHFLITPSKTSSLPAAMQSLNTRYVWHFNKRHERTGGLFEGRYRAGVVDNDSYLKVCYQYIELNPVRAKLCQQPGDYHWSSYRFHAFGEPDPLVTLHKVYTMLGTDDKARQKRYRGWFKQSPAEDDLAQIRSGV